MTFNFENIRINTFRCYKQKVLSAPIEQIVLYMTILLVIAPKWSYPPREARIRYATLSDFLFVVYITAGKRTEFLPHGREETSIGRGH